MGRIRTVRFGLALRGKLPFTKALDAACERVPIIVFDNGTSRLDLAVNRNALYTLLRYSTLITITNGCRMPPGAQLSIAELRRSARFAVDYKALAAHRNLGELTLAIANISMVGFRLNARAVIGRGERLMVQLPEYGRLEAFCIWTRSQQAGFMFERPIPRDKFELVVASMKAANLPSIVSGAKP